MEGKGEAERIHPSLESPHRSINEARCITVMFPYRYCYICNSTVINQNFLYFICTALLSRTILRNPPMHTQMPRAERQWSNTSFP